MSTNDWVREVLCPQLLPAHAAPVLALCDVADAARSFSNLWDTHEHSERTESALDEALETLDKTQVPDD